MRRGPVIGNVFSITSSYLLLKSVTKFLNKRLPKNNKYPWWWKEVTTTEETEIKTTSTLQICTSVPDFISVSPSFINKDIENTITQRIAKTENEVSPLNDIRSQYFVSILETGNKWIENGINTFILYFVVLFCLVYVPLHDLYEYKGLKRTRNELHCDNGRDNLQIYSGTNDDQINSKGQNNVSSNQDKNINSSVVNSIIKDDALEVEDKLGTIAEEIEYKDREDSPQDKDCVTKTKNLSNHKTTSLFVSTDELSHSSKNDRASLDSLYKSDQFYQTSQSSTVSSASSFIQFSPSKQPHLDAQVNTRNAYSQPFRFK